MGDFPYLSKRNSIVFVYFPFFFFLVYFFLRIVSILTMPADLKPLCPAHPTSLKGDSCAGAPDKKGTHDTDCLATRAPELFQQVISARRNAVAKMNSCRNPNVQSDSPR